MPAGRLMWAGGLVLAVLAIGTRAQTSPPGPPAPVASPAAVLRDSLKALPTAVADTVRPAALVPDAEPSDPVTRPLALRITAAIVVLTLSTLLLYNVRSR